MYLVEAHCWLEAKHSRLSPIFLCVLFKANSGNKVGENAMWVIRKNTFISAVLVIHYETYLQEIFVSGDMKGMFSQMRDAKKHGKGIANDKGNRTWELFYRTELTMAEMAR